MQQRDHHSALHRCDAEDGFSNGRSAVPEEMPSERQHGAPDDEVFATLLAAATKRAGRLLLILPAQPVADRRPVPIRGH